MTKHPYRVLPRADIDALDFAFHFADQTGDFDLSDRFAESVRRTIDAIADDPTVRPISIHAPQGDRTLRHWPVDGFPNHLIFYRFDGTRVTIERVLHAARDMTGLFEP